MYRSRNCCLRGSLIAATILFHKLVSAVVCMQKADAQGHDANQAEAVVI